MDSVHESEPKQLSYGPENSTELQFTALKEKLFWIFLTYFFKSQSQKLIGVISAEDSENFKQCPALVLEQREIFLSVLIYHLT